MTEKICLWLSKSYNMYKEANTSVVMNPARKGTGIGVNKIYLLLWTDGQEH